MALRLSAFGLSWFRDCRNTAELTGKIQDIVTHVKARDSPQAKVFVEKAERV